MDIATDITDSGTNSLDQRPLVTSQFWSVISSTSIPSGIGGNGGSCIFYDQLWGTGAHGVLGSTIPYGTMPTNNSELSDRANNLSTVFFSRYKYPNVDLKYRGIIVPDAGVIGTVCYTFTHFGPITHIKTSPNLYSFGCEKDVYDNFGRLKITGLGNLIAARTVDGSFFVSDRFINKYIKLDVLGTPTYDAVTKNLNFTQYEIRVPESTQITGVTLPLCN
jgi:hypothetical protein